MTLSSEFYWAVGIENTFIPQEQPGLRALDEYELTQHYQLWREDIDRAAELGVSHIRWGVPWYRVNPQPGYFEWGWIDEVLDYLVNQKRLTPIIDLVHYGTPLWVEQSFVEPSYPQYVAEYAHAFATRYADLVRFYTPLNEPTLNAEFSGQRGEWPPYLKGRRGYTSVLLPIVRGMVLTTKAVRAADPDAIFVQVEALRWGWTQEPSLQAKVDQFFAQTYLAFDLFSGRVNHEHMLWPNLRRHGATEEELFWFLEQRETVDILGVNVYPWSGGEIVRAKNGRPRLRLGIQSQHVGDILCDAWQRYQLPLMVTETSAKGNVEKRAKWMDETIAAVQQVREEGVPVIGYTWFPMLTMVDWAYRVKERPLADYLLHLGLWESAFDESGVLQRYPTPLVERYREYVNSGRYNPTIAV